jgi:acetylornithine deacetylase
MKIDTVYLLDTLKTLVSINSSNPDLSPNGAGEAQIAAYVNVACLALGMRSQIITHAAGRQSVLAVLPGTGGGRSLMLNAHMDTVGIEGMDAPFQPRVVENRLYGRGAQDMKGSLASCLAAVKALCDACVELRGDLIIAAVADEENASIGTAGLLHQVIPDAAIVTEPTGLEIAVAHRGFAWLEIETFGRAAHGSRYWEGIDANRMMGFVLVELDGLDQHLSSLPSHPLLGRGSLHASRLHGGTELSSYAAQCTLQVERRTLPGEDGASALAELQTILDRLADANQRFTASARLLLERPPFQARIDSELLPILRQAAVERLDQPPQLIGVAFWMDAALLAAAGVDTLAIGPIGGGLHTTEEWVDLESLASLAGILAETARVYLS